MGEKLSWFKKSQNRTSNNLNDKQEQKPKMLMSLCLMELTALEPKSYSETKEIFDQFKVPIEDQEKDEIIKDSNLVVQIEKKFYSFETGAPKLIDYGQA